MRNVTDENGATPPSRRFVLVLVLALLMGGILVAMAFSYRSFEHYMAHDPAFCAECHVTQNQYELWADSEHRKVACQACHQQSREEALNTLRNFLFSDGSEPPHSPRVPSTACASCHRHNDQRWVQIGASAGHQVHIDRGDVSCLSCHARSIHRFAAAQETCGDCHEEHVNEASGMESLHCLACHNFLDHQDSLRPSREVCLDCHRSRGLQDFDYPPSAPMANLPCWSCHHPHEGTKPKMVQCVTCHEEAVHLGLHDNPEHAVCTACHPAHTWLPTPDRCTGCHEVRARCDARKDCWSCHKVSSDRGEP